MDEKTESSGFNTELLQFLKERSSYPHSPPEVRHIQTHISHVFIAPPFVYKFKKPVDFGFLDYSTLEKRRKFCRREVQLNRRLTEGIYLGVVGIARRKGEGGYVIGSVDQDLDADSIVEYAVKMRKLPDEYFLHSHIQNDSLSDGHLDRVADKLAQFYGDQQPGEELSEWGAIEKIKVNTDENFNQTKRFVGETIQSNAYRAIQYYTDEYYREHEDLFQKRRGEGRIVDGHGDLHLDHIHISPDRVMIYDCIEFNDRFRYGDLAADLAFLAMDLDFNGCWREDLYFIDRMAEKLADEDLPRIINFYKCYRAYVKGKVKSLQSTEEEVPPGDRREAAALASRYFDLSLRYALAGSEAMVLIFMGRVGTGKSTLSEKLSDTLNIARYSSDHIRKKSMGLPLSERTPDSQRDRLYSKEVTASTYRMLREKAAGGEEGSVILDATFSDNREREKMEGILESKDINYVFIEARATDETIKNRLRARDARRNVISDARLEDFDKLSNAYDAPDEIDPQHFIPIDTNQEVEASIWELYRKLVQRNVLKASQ